MKQLLCKFANWILRKCTPPYISFQDNIYINGRLYHLLQWSVQKTPQNNYQTTIEIKMETERDKAWS